MTHLTTSEQLELIQAAIAEVRAKRYGGTTEFYNALDRMLHISAQMPLKQPSSDDKVQSRLVTPEGANVPQKPLESL